MADGKRCATAAAVDKCGKFGLVGIPEAVDELRQRLLILSHLERLERDWLGTASPPVCFDRDGSKTLVETADVNLALFSEDNCLRPIAGHMVAADLHLGRKILAEPEAE